MGIGGAGMSGLALLLKQSGLNVTGCDVSRTYYIKKISDMGIQFSLGHSHEHLEEYSPDALIYSSAIPADNRELLEAERRGLPVFKRAEVLSWLFNQRIGVGVAGTHGKTTTASMTGLIFEEAGLNPTVAIGGELCDIGGNAKLGGGPHMIAELDESDGSFELFRSNLAVITNADWDHVDYYPNFSSVLDAYSRFLANRTRDGIAIVCGEDKGSGLLLEGRIEEPVLTYGWGYSWDWGAANVTHNQGGGVSYTVLRKGEPAGEIRLQVSGDHNVLNSLAACAVADISGIGLDVAAKALKTFSGAKRRLQWTGGVRNRDIDVFDDYGHHPREVSATLTTLKTMFPERRILTVFQPHRFTRTAAMYREFADVLTMSDEIFLLPIFAADEIPIDGVTSTLIGDLVVQKGHRSFSLCNNMDEVVSLVCSQAKSGDVITTIGAGDVFTVGEKILEHMKGVTAPSDAMAIEI